MREQACVYLFVTCLCVTDEDVDNEEVYKMANVMSQCGGLQVMLKRYQAAVAGLYFHWVANCILLKGLL